MKIFFFLVSLAFIGKSAKGQLTIQSLKILPYGQSSIESRKLFDRLTTAFPSTLCSENNLFKVKQFEYSNVQFDLWGKANKMELFFVKDSLISIRSEFNFKLSDTSLFQRFLKIVFLQLNSDSQMEKENNTKENFQALVKKIYNENITPVRHSAKNYFKNVYYINNSDNYFQTFIDISITYNNDNRQFEPIYKFILQLNNFNMAKLANFYYVEVGSLPLSNKDCY